MHGDVIEDAGDITRDEPLAYPARGLGRFYTVREAERQRDIASSFEMPCCGSQHGIKSGAGMAVPHNSSRRRKQVPESTKPLVMPTILVLVNVARLWLADNLVSHNH